MGPWTLLPLAGAVNENLRNLRVYRTAGLEYVDIIRAQAREHAELNRALNRIRLREFKALTQRGLTNEKTQAALAPFDQFATAFSASGDDLNGLVSDLTARAAATLRGARLILAQAKRVPAKLLAHVQATAPMAG